MFLRKSNHLVFDRNFFFRVWRWFHWFQRFSLFYQSVHARVCVCGCFILRIIAPEKFHRSNKKRRRGSARIQLRAFSVFCLFSRPRRILTPRYNSRRQKSANYLYRILFSFLSFIFLALSNHVPTILKLVSANISHRSGELFAFDDVSAGNHEFLSVYREPALSEGWAEVAGLWLVSYSITSW